MATTYTLAAAAANARASGQTASAEGVLARTGTVHLTANVTANDIYELFWLPKGAIPFAAELNADVIDTNGTQTFQASVGIQSNAAQGGTDALAPASLIPATVLKGTAESETDNANNRRNNPVNPQPLTAKTKVLVKFPAVAATFAAGYVTVTVYYKTPGSATS